MAKENDEKLAGIAAVLMEKLELRGIRLIDLACFDSVKEQGEAVVAEALAVEFPLADVETIHLAAEELCGTFGMFAETAANDQAGEYTDEDYQRKTLAAALWELRNRFG